MPDAPSPADMPGAADAAAAGSDEHDDTTDAPESTDTVETDPLQELARLRAIHKDERRWEKRAKSNAEKARMWDDNAEKVKRLEEIEAAQRTKEEQLQLERDQLRKELDGQKLENLRIRIAQETKVPARFITGATESEMREAAEEYNDQRDRDMEERLKALNINPAAPASQVTSDGKPVPLRQLTRADLSNMSRKEILAAEKSGQMDDLLGRASR